MTKEALLSILVFAPFGLVHLSADACGFGGTWVELALMSAYGMILVGAVVWESRT